MIFWPKKVQGSLQLCLNYDLYLLKLESSRKKSKECFKFFFNFTFFRFEKSHPKIKNSKKKFCTASQNTFKINILKN